MTPLGSLKPTTCRPFGPQVPVDAGSSARGEGAPPRRSVGQRSRGPARLRMIETGCRCEHGVGRAGHVTVPSSVAVDHRGPPNEAARGVHRRSMVADTVRPCCGVDRADAGCPDEIVVAEFVDEPLDPDRRRSIVCSTRTDRVQPPVSMAPPRRYLCDRGAARASAEGGRVLADRVDPRGDPPVGRALRDRRKGDHRPDLHVGHARPRRTPNRGRSIAPTISVREPVLSSRRTRAPAASAHRSARTTVVDAEMRRTRAALA